ncbi:MAG: Gldg family protein [Deltaproteobacteria bacterium]|nr:Gldg family protein [Deltaproteobacteria bacterium]
MQRNTLVLLSLLGALLAAIVCGVSAYLLAHIPLVWKISGVIALVLAVIYLVLEYKVFAGALSKKTTKYGLNSILMAVLGLFIVVVVNLIVSEHDWKKDITKNKLHTLSEESLKVLKNLKSEVKFRAFVYPTQVHEYDNVFEKYAYHSKLLKKEYVDLDKEPFAVQKYGIKQAGTIIVESETRTAKVENIFSPDDPKLEEKLTNAIIQVAKGEKKKIYFVTGHGEKLLSDSGRDGYSEMKETLESGRYKTEELVLVDKDKVPPDADILVCMGPKSDFMDHELTLIENYVRAGGKFFVMVDPLSTPTLKPFLTKFGIDWKPRKTVLETNRLQQLAGGNPLAPIVASYDSSHEITQEARQISIFPIPTPVEKLSKQPEGMKVSSLFSTSARSFEVDLKGEKVTLNEKTDRKGPISLAIAASGKSEHKEKDKASANAAQEQQKKDAEKKDAVKSDDPKKEEAAKEKEAEFRLVVVGASAFASNSVRKFGINADLFQNMLSWLSKEEDLISVRPRPTDVSELEMTDERARIINLASIIVAPFGMLFAGLAVWMRRRRL